VIHGHAGIAGLPLPGKVQSQQKEMPMGLDAAEIMLDLEEEFGISIADDEVICFFSTLGNVHDLLLEKCTGRKRTDCPTRSAFYRLRRTMEAAWGVEPQSLRPTTSVLSLLGRWKRQRKWTRLERELGLTLPRLENRAGAGVLWGALTFAPGAFFVTLVLAGDLFVAVGAAVVGLLPGVLLGYVVGLCWIPTVWQECRTVGRLARVLAAENDREFRVSEEPATEDDPIWNRLCKVLVRELGVRREDLRRETRFVEDLGF